MIAFYFTRTVLFLCALSGNKGFWIQPDGFFPETWLYYQIIIRRLRGSIRAESAGQERAWDPPGPRRNPEKRARA